MSVDSLTKAKLIPGISIFVGTFIVVLIALSLEGPIANKYLLALIYSFLIFVLIKILQIYNVIEKPSYFGEGFVRYSMLCNNCHWEWMSNVTEKESPTKCPHCGEKDRLEIIGYRKVQKMSKKEEADLRNFFKEKI